MYGTRMGRSILLALTLLAAAPVRAAGGPDGFGYTWIANSDPGGPALEWIDISTVGTPVTGLADDNSASVITLPQPFRYYWSDLSTVTIGSNGWTSLLPTSNIASCFPTIPAAGGPADAYLAPLMSDLNFTGAGNPGSVRTYHDAAANLFIISYLNVPYWQVNAPGFVGSNTFQVVFDYNDRSIRFNYSALSPPLLTAACVDMVIGIESPTGSYGLQLFQDTIPTAPATIRFNYPAVPLISVIDPAPDDSMNVVDSAAVVVEAGTPLTLRANVVNSGTDATTSATDVRGEVLMGSSGASVLYDQTVSVPVLNANQSMPIVFVPDYVPVPGVQRLRVGVSGGGDINAGNNQVVSEIHGLQPRAGNQILSYTDATTSNGSLNWNGGGGSFQYGAAIFIDPPNDRYRVRRRGVFISSALPTDNYALELRDNDGPQGSPGTSLGLIEVPAGSVLTAQWNDRELPQAAAVDADGFYLVWYQRSTTIFMGTSLEPTLSRRGFELLAGQFATYRNNQTTELMLRVTMEDDNVFGDGFE